MFCLQGSRPGHDQPVDCYTDLVCKLETVESQIYQWHIRPGNPVR